MSSRYPIPPGVVARVVRAAADPDTRIADLTRLLESDAVLASQMLRTANSAMFGLRHKVASIERAIAIMGLRAVRNIALSMGVRDLVQADGLDALPLDLFWEGSLRRASAAQAIAEHLELDQREELFTLGLCQDIGVLECARADAAHAARLAKAIRQPAAARLALERESGDGHAHVGAEMFEAWEFPEELSVPLRHHHDPATAPEAYRRRASVAQAAESIADLSVVTDLGLAQRNVVEALGGLEIAEEEIGGIVNRVNELVSEFSELLGVEVTSQPAYEEIVAAASRGLAELNLSYEDMTRKLESSLAEQQRMAAELQRLNGELAREARTDALTGIPNRRSFDEMLERELAVAQRQGTPLSLLLFDLDHFKSINDNAGHQVGDLVIQAVGRSIAEFARTTDVAARYGGEEFAVILPFTDRDGGLIAADRHRERIERLVVAAGESTLSPTASVGGATLGAVELPRRELIDDLVRRADRALYRAKERGRNRVCWDDGSEPAPLDAELASSGAPRGV